MEGKVVDALMKIADFDNIPPANLAMLCKVMLDIGNIPPYSGATLPVDKDPNYRVPWISAYDVLTLISRIIHNDIQNLYAEELLSDLPSDKQA